MDRLFRRLTAALVLALIFVLPGQAAAEANCPDASFSFNGSTTAGVPDEGLISSDGGFLGDHEGSFDEFVHQASIGSSSCRIRSLSIKMTSPGFVDDPSADYDLVVEWEGIDIGRSANGGTNELIEFTEAHYGVYTFHVEPWLVVDAPYLLEVNADLQPTKPARGANKSKPFVVIAVVDTGINPYHDEFSYESYPDPSTDFTVSPAQYLEEYPEVAPPLYLSLGTTNYAEAVAADRPILNAIEEDKLYWIPGTKIVGAYDGGGSLTSPPTRVLDEQGHGTQSAGVAVGNTTGSCPRCLLVAVEGTGGLEWAMAQPWIDFVSNSWGTRGNVGAPTTGKAQLLDRTPKNTRAAVARGQTVLFAAGNGFANAFESPAPTYESNQAGPDWVMTVGAVWRHGNAANPVNCNCPTDEGAIIGSGKPVDVSSWGLNSIEGDLRGPTFNSISGYDDHSGTSSATPITAGVMGDILLHARTKLGDVVGGTRNDAIAEGITPMGTGMLAGARLTRAELERLTKYTAQHTNSRWTGIFPQAIPTQNIPESLKWSQWAIEGWGVVAPRTGAVAKSVLDGTAALAERPMDEALAAYDRSNREALWGPAV